MARASGKTAMQASAVIVRPRPSVRLTAVAEADKREQVDGGADAEREGRDRVELGVDVGERDLEGEREEDDRGDHRQVQVGVDVAGERDACLALRSVEELLSADREEVEVREPERRRDEEAEERCNDDTGVEMRCRARRGRSRRGTPRSR